MVRSTSILALAFLLVIGLASAGCAEQAYEKACNSCEFDENGKMDRSCMEKHQEDGIGCYVTKYPVSSQQYYEGKCQEMAACEQKFRDCSDGAGSGLEELDCSTDRMRGCFKEVDTCVELAARECGEPMFCVPGMAVLGVLGTAAFLSASPKRGKSA